MARTDDRLAGRRSLLLRVVISTALTAAVGSAIAGFTAKIATTNLLAEHDEEIQRIATMRLAYEIEEEQEESGETLRAALEDELGDIDYVGASGAVHEGGVLLEGDPDVVPQPEGDCAQVELRGTPHRVCTRSYKGREFSLAVSAAHTRSIERLLSFATVLAVLIGALAGVLFGGAATRWALRPFEQLVAQVRAVRPHAPDSSVLLPPADYREIEDLRRAVVDLVDRLGTALTQAQRFAAHASHELRTPLTALAGEIDLMLESERADTEALLALRRRVRAMTSLVERLLALAAPNEIGGGEAIDLEDVANESLLDLPEELRKRVVVSSESDILVSGDATLLRMAVTNALDNALKFSSGRVELRIRARQGEALIEILDSGPGVAVSERERVFDAFYRSPNARRGGVRGHGIGLALIAHVARAHGGRARFQDVPDGACLQIVLPRWLVEAAV